MSALDALSLLHLVGTSSTRYTGVSSIQPNFITTTLASTGVMESFFARFFIVTAAVYWGFDSMLCLAADISS